MRILFICEAFPPETKSASTLFFELAESLVRKGHTVDFITKMPKTNLAQGVDLKRVSKRENYKGINVVRLSAPPLPRNIPVVRGLEHFILGLIFFLRGLFVKRPDAILIYSPPLTLGITGLWLSIFKRCPVIVNIQDLFPQAVIDLGLLTNKTLINISEYMERLVYQKASLLTVHSESNRQYVVGRGAAEDKVNVIPNWVDTDLIVPGDKENEFSRKHSIADKFVVSFAGVMGFPQGLEVVIKTADILRNERDILFLLVGDGVKRQSLEDLTEKLNLSNIMFVPTQPLSVYPSVLHSSDIGLVTLVPESLTPVVPGKLFSIMAAGIPVIASLPFVGDAQKIIDESQLGYCVKPGDPVQLAEAVLKLYNDPVLRKKMGINGRRVAVDHFSRRKWVKEYERLMEQIGGNNGKQQIFRCL